MPETTSREWIMKFLNAKTPQFTLEEVRAFARQNFGLEGSLIPLYSERDQNFRLSTTDGSDWVIKIANAEEDEAVLDCQTMALNHLHRVAPELPLPRVLPSPSGASLTRLEGTGGKTYFAYVVSWLNGNIASKCKLKASDFLNIGAAIARLQRALSGFFHPAAGNRHLLWDVREVHHFRGGLHLLGAFAAEAGDLIEHFVSSTLPKLERLRAQVIHGDVHGHNLILGTNNEINGIIDFGDMFHGPAILDLSDAMADFFHDTEDCKTMWQALVRGYNAVQPIEPAELELLFDLMIMRELTTILITESRRVQTPDQPNYIRDSGFGSLSALKHMLAIGRQQATDIFAVAAGLRPLPATASRTDLIERRKKVMGSRLYVFYDPPLHIVRGEGVFLFDADGKPYLDCYNNVPIVGHCNPRVVGAISAQARILNTNTRYLGEQVLEYAERLGALSGGGLTACAFVNSGSEANDIAWRMAKAWTGHQGFITQEFAYHGITDAIDAVSPSAIRHGAIPPHVRTILAPDGYRGIYEYGTPDMGRRYAGDVDEAIQSLAQTGLKPAAVILDSAFMTNGILEPCEGYVAEVFARVRKAGGLCIADEVQSGFGRMGSQFWGYKHHGVTPDFITIGKPAGNGHPIGVVLTRPEILDHFCNQTAFFSTFGGNNVSCAAGLAVLDEIAGRNLVVQAAEVGAYFKAGLKRLQQKHAIIGDVRGIGLGYGVELVKDRAAREPALDQTNQFLNMLRDQGVLAGSEGVHGNIVKMRPPLIFTRENADYAIAAMDKAFDLLS